eukprot:1195170-Prorocentrum_minimum.AAC.3
MTAEAGGSYNNSLVEDSGAERKEVNQALVKLGADEFEFFSPQEYEEFLKRQGCKYHQEECSGCGVRAKLKKCKGCKQVSTKHDAHNNNNNNKHSVTSR